VIGRNCRFLQGPRTDPSTVQRLATALHEGREVTVELLNYRKSGEEFYNMLRCAGVVGWHAGGAAVRGRTHR
jgi:hypothetical protein